MRALTADNPAQIARLREIEDLVKAKLDELAGTIRLQDAGDPSGALRAVEAGFGGRTVERVPGKRGLDALRGGAGCSASARSAGGRPPPA